ncbi:hypothetical protein C0992_007136 [Termitomyces sp. T32_za158]|nr:hypothetical protein C0992_007136 [Termitomyces sp. T32_za158]
MSACHSRPRAPPPARTPPSPLAHQQSIAEYVKRRNSVLRGLRISPEEFAHQTQTLLWDLGQKYPNGSPEDWVHRLLDFNNQGAAGRLPESVRKDLQQNAFMRNELQSLVDEIYVSPNPGTFKDPADPARSFHIQRGAPSHPGDASRIPGQRNQEEQDATSTTLHALNPGGGLFKQPAARTIGLSTCQRANSVLSAVQTWGQAVRKNPGGAPPPRLPHDGDARSDDTLCYIDPPAPPQSEPASFHHERLPHFDLRQTWGRDTPPPPAPRLFNRGPPRTPLGPPLAPPVPHQAPPAGPPLGPPPPTLTRGHPNPHKGHPAPHRNNPQRPHCHDPPPGHHLDTPRLLAPTTRSCRRYPAAHCTPAPSMPKFPETSALTPAISASTLIDPTQPQSPASTLPDLTAPPPASPGDHSSDHFHHPGRHPKTDH